MDKTIYEQDYYLWLDTTAQLLKEGKFSELDLENLIEEIVSLKLQEKKALRNHLKVIFRHLLKYKYLPEDNNNNCSFIIFQHQDELSEYLTDSPSLKTFLQEIFEETYNTARRQTAIETGLPIETFPSESPFPLDHILDLNYLPE